MNKLNKNIETFNNKHKTQISINYLNILFIKNGYDLSSYIISKKDSIKKFNDHPESTIESDEEEINNKNIIYTFFKTNNLNYPELYPGHHLKNTGKKLNISNIDLNWTTELDNIFIKILKLICKDDIFKYYFPRNNTLSIPNKYDKDDIILIEEVGPKISFLNILNNIKNDSILYYKIGLDGEKAFSMKINKLIMWFIFKFLYGYVYYICTAILYVPLSFLFTIFLFTILIAYIIITPIVQRFIRLFIYDPYNNYSTLFPLIGNILYYILFNVFGIAIGSTIYGLGSAFFNFLKSILLVGFLFNNNH